MYKTLTVGNEREDISDRFHQMQLHYFRLLFLPRLCFSFSSHLSLSLSFSVSLRPSRCLVYLLSQPRKSRDYQRNNPSGRGLLLPASTESLLFFPLFLPQVLSYFLSEAGGEGPMMGDIPLLARNGKSLLNIHPLLVFCLIRPSSEFILSTILLPACSSPLVYLHLSSSVTRPIGTHTNTHTVYSPPVPRASCLSLIRVSSEWGGGCRRYTCPQINPAV